MTQGSAELYQHYFRIYSRVESILINLKDELSKEDIYMLQRVKRGVLKEAKGE